MSAWIQGAWKIGAWRGTAWAENTPPPPPVIIQPPSGVKRGRKHELIVSLKDVESRESTAEYLKSQLRLRHPGSAFKDTSAEDAKEQKSIASRERAMRKAARLEAAKLEAAQAAQLTEENNKRILMILAQAI